jgi:superoxide reductase
MVGMLNNSGVPIVCCGEPMTLLVANTVDAAKEKHVPVVSRSGNTVKVEVGSVPHPMTKEHYIQWIYLETKQGGQRRGLTPEDEPKAAFALEDDEPVAVYEYCNLHGLWKTDL